MNELTRVEHAVGYTDPLTGSAWDGVKWLFRHIDGYGAEISPDFSADDRTVMVESYDSGHGLTLRRMEPENFVQFSRSNPQWATSLKDSVDDCYEIIIVEGSVQETGRMFSRRMMSGWMEVIAVPHWSGNKALFTAKSLAEILGRRFKSGMAIGESATKFLACAIALGNEHHQV